MDIGVTYGTLKDSSMSSWGGRPTEDMMWSAAFTDDTEWNEAAWGNIVQTDSTKRFMN